MITFVLLFTDFTVDKIIKFHFFRLEEAKETLHTETRQLKDNLESKNKESSNLISELQVFSSKLVQLEQRITEDKENFDSTLASRETVISELKEKVMIAQG